MSERRPTEQRRLTPDERERLRAGVFAEIDRQEGRTRRRRRRMAGAGVVLAAVAVLGVVALRTPHAPTTDTAGSIPVRCTTGDTTATVTAPSPRARATTRASSAPSCGAAASSSAARASPRRSTACARTDAREVLVLVTSDGDDGCRAGGSSDGSTSQQ